MLQILKHLNLLQFQVSRSNKHTDHTKKSTFKQLDESGSHGNNEFQQSLTRLFDSVMKVLNLFLTNPLLSNAKFIYTVPENNSDKKCCATWKKIGYMKFIFNGIFFQNLMVKRHFEV